MRKYSSFNLKDLSENTMALENISSLYRYNIGRMWQIAAITLVLLVILFLTKKFYFDVKKQFKKYTTILQNLGYKVYTIKLKPFRVPILSIFRDSQKIHKDALYNFKHEYSKYDFVLVNFLHSFSIMIVNPNIFKHFVSIENFSFYEKLPLDAMVEILGQGILFVEGQEWKKKRKTISKVFKHQLIIENIPAMKRIMDRCFDQFEQKSQVKGGYKYNVMEISNHVFANFMTQCFFGVDQIPQQIQGVEFPIFASKILVDSCLISISPIVLLLGKWAYKWSVNQKIRNLKHRVSILRAIGQQIIIKKRKELQNQKQNKTCTDLLSALIMQKNINSDDYQYTNKDIIEQFCTFLMAGMDTTSHFVTMMVYYISTNTEIQRKLRQHINQIIHSDEDITLQNLKKLTYIDWIQNETTRFYGPGSNLLLRKALANHMLGDIPISTGTFITAIMTSMNYSQQYFKEPHVFNPERWENQHQSHNQTIVGFGFSGGPRSCIGKYMALLNSKIFLVKLILRYKTLTGPKEELTMYMHFLYEPNPFLMQFTK